MEAGELYAETSCNESGKRWGNVSEKQMEITRRLFISPQHAHEAKKKTNSEKHPKRDGIVSGMKKLRKLLIPLLFLFISYTLMFFSLYLFMFDAKINNFKIEKILFEFKFV